MAAVMVGTVVTMVVRIVHIHQKQAVQKVVQNRAQKVHLKPLNQAILVQNQHHIQANIVCSTMVENQRLLEMLFEQVQTLLLCLVGNPYIQKQKLSQIQQMIFHHYTEVILQQTICCTNHYSILDTIMSQ